MSQSASKAKPEFADFKRQEVPMSLRAVALAIVRDLKIHEGLWGLRVVFTTGATIYPIRGVPTPTGLISLTELGIERVKQESPSTVDAALENPPPPTITLAAN